MINRKERKQKGEELQKKLQEQKDKMDQLLEHNIGESDKPLAEKDDSFEWEVTFKSVNSMLKEDASDIDSPQRFSGDDFPSKSQLLEHLQNELPQDVKIMDIKTV